MTSCMSKMRGPECRQMQSSRLTADLGAVEHQVVGLRPGSAQVAAVGHVVAAGRREWVVQGLQPGLVLVPAAAWRRVSLSGLPMAGLNVCRVDCLLTATSWVEALGRPVLRAGTVAQPVQCLSRN